MPGEKKTQQPIETDGPSPSKIKELMVTSALKADGAKQQKLDLAVEKQAEVGGLEMGVLSDGTPFLSGRALALVCDVHHSMIASLAEDWSEPQPKARVQTIKRILANPKGVYMLRAVSGDARVVGTVPGPRSR